MTRPTPARAPVLDLAAIVEASPPKRSAMLDLARFDVSALGVGEILALCTAAEVDPAALAGALATPGPTRGRVAVALAWVIARRREPDLTYDDVATWAIEVRAGPADPTPATPDVADHRPPRKPRPRRGPAGS